MTYDLSTGKGYEASVRDGRRCNSSSVCECVSMCMCFKIERERESKREREMVYCSRTIHRSFFAKERYRLFSAGDAVSRI